MPSLFAIQEPLTDVITKLNGEETASSYLSTFDLIRHADPVVKFVIFVLGAMSVTTWGIAFTKAFQMRRAKRESKNFSDIFWTSGNLAQINEMGQRFRASPVASVFSAGYHELVQVVKGKESRQNGGEATEDVESIERALKRAKAEEITRLEFGTTFLATTASAGPVIGLFGTVWGIMNAFRGLSHLKSSSIQAVAPGISEALIATAIGLVAAIPAAIAYNYFMQQLRVLSRNMDMFSSEFLNIARRHFLR